MISVLGKTYRIVSRSKGTYDAVRLLDDVRIGTFGFAPSCPVSSAIGGETLLRQIAEIAMRSGKTRWTPRQVQ
jgi:hypothetical protein